MECTGDVGAEDIDNVVIRGDVQAREFIAFWLRDGRVLAGMNVNVWDATAAIKHLIQSKTHIDVDRLTSVDVALDALD
jgi:3-phenylpropionate/trans-cinnamate dioxygenase ferredoxin reductase subunit